MRKTALQQVLALARQDERVCFVGSDLGFGVMDEFGAAFPRRFFREGISEQHVIGMSAGLALEGRIVYVNTIASFLTRRCFEQIYLDLCLHRTRVRLLGSGGGVVYAPLGPTHLAPDDFALLRPLPHMTVLAPCDAQEMRALMPLTLEMDGPVYVRLAKGGDLVVSRPDTPYALGRAVLMTPPCPHAEVLFITTGITAQIALRAAQALQGQGVTAAVLHCHTVKPLDVERILDAARRAEVVFPVEEHVATGGLGAAVAMLLMEANLPRPPHFLHAALPDAFLCEHGSQEKILQKYSISAEGLVRRVLERRA